MSAPEPTMFGFTRRGKRSSLLAFEHLNRDGVTTTVRG